MERDSNYCSEWSYENLSYWNSEIHGKCLSYRHFQFKLYPRGLSGEGEHLVVGVYDPNLSSRVELSFIGSDGTIFYKQEIQDPKWNPSGYLVLPPGPRFEDVQTTKNNLHKDILTLRLYRSDHTGMKFHGHSTIEVADTCLRMPAIMLKDVELEKYTWISGISLDNGHRRYDLNLNAHLMGSTLEDAEISFVLIPSFEKNILIHTFISLFDNNDVVVKSEENTHIFRGKENWKFPGLLQRKEITKKQFHLTLCVKYVSGDVRNVDFLASVEYKESSPVQPITVPPENLTEDLTVVSTSHNPVTVLLQELMCLYQDQDFSDMQLECGTVSFPVHRAILSARSPVFKTMLSTDMREAASGCMDIVDLDPSTLSHFLTFLYTGGVEDLQCDSALKLYYASDKYQVPTLKMVCADFLCANVSISNVCDILSLADKHQDVKLMEVSQDFILKNYNEVLKSEEWKSFMLKEPLLGVKTLTQFVERNNMGVIGGKVI